MSQARDQGIFSIHMGVSLPHVTISLATIAMALNEGGRAQFVEWFDDGA